MTRTIARLLLVCAASALAGFAQQPPPQPQLLPCGEHSGADVLCGTRSPEDLELTPDGKYLVVAQFVGQGRGGARPAGAGLVLFEIATKKFTKMTITADPKKDWGDPACPGAIGEEMVPHGISLGKRANGAMQLYVVNHGGRQSIEMFELKKDSAGWSLAWHGCAPTMNEFNDVAVLRDGGFVATHPLALRTPGDNSNLFEGKPSGYVSRWVPGKGESELEGTRAGYPNGVLVSADEKTMYFNAWTNKEVHKYDLMAGKETGVVKLDFMPDNVTWISNRRMLAAGVKGTRGNCGDEPCIQSFGIAEIDPARMTARPVFDSATKPGLIAGVSVGLAVKNSIYIGAFQGDRIVRIDWKP